MTHGGKLTFNGAYYDAKLRLHLLILVDHLIYIVTLIELIALYARLDYVSDLLHDNHLLLLLSLSLLSQQSSLLSTNLNFYLSSILSTIFPFLALLILILSIAVLR